MGLVALIAVVGLVGFIGFMRLVDLVGLVHLVAHNVSIESTYTPVLIGSLIQIPNTSIFILDSQQ